MKRDEKDRGARPSSEAIEALKARRAAASAGHRPAALPRKPPTPASKRGPLWAATIAVLLAWAGTATYLAIDNHRNAARLLDEQVAQRLANEDRVRALTRRLVGVASQQVLEQDGLAERLADIITRQVELENRQSTLGLIADRLAGAPAPAPSAPGPGKGGALEPPAGAARSRLAESLARLPLRDQFGRLETSLDRVAGAQTTTLASFGAVVRGRIETARTALAELGLKIAPDPRATAAAALPRSGPPGAADPFAREVARLETTFAEGESWKALEDGLPLQVPLGIEGNTTSNFGVRHDPFTGAATMHAGMDFRSPVGTPAHATGIGRVISADVRGGYGNMVEIDHGHDLTTRYAHLSAIQVTVGQTVAPGTVVGLVGSTGRSTGPHLHYETRVAGTALDPARFIGAGARLHGQPARSLPAPASSTPEVDTPPPEDGADD